MKLSCALIALVLGVASARRKLVEGDEYDGLANETISDAPPCARTAKCTNSKFNVSQCSEDKQEFPGFDIISLKQDNNSVPSKAFPQYKNKTYDIINCGDQWVATWLAGNSQLLAGIALNDSKQGIKSNYGFKALFKANSSIKPVQEVFTLIQEAEIPYIDGCHGGARPALICTDKSHPAIPQSLLNACKERGPIISTTDYPSATILCPGFITDYPDIIANGTRPCPYNKQKLNDPDGKFQNTTNVMVMNALAWTYLGDGYYYTELDDVETAVAWDQEESIYNGANYAYYALAIETNCQGWP